MQGDLHRIPARGYETKQGKALSASRYLAVHESIFGVNLAGSDAGHSFHLVEALYLRSTKDFVGVNNDYFSYNLLRDFWGALRI
jgi:hypothetical protein